ncbi:hypothetical protein QYF36_020018 [Acer negundo]|nr:hypothetical protein QYF36_020018 [Acer negundo]
MLVNDGIKLDLVVEEEENNSNEYRCILSRLRLSQSQLAGPCYIVIFLSVAIFVSPVIILIHLVLKSFNKDASGLGKCPSRRVLFGIVRQIIAPQFSTDYCNREEDDLRDFAYDLEDLLDEHNTDILKRSLNAQSNGDASSKPVEELKTLWDNFNKISSSRGMNQRLEELYLPSQVDSLSL